MSFALQKVKGAAVTKSYPSNSSFLFSHNIKSIAENSLYHFMLGGYAIVHGMDFPDSHPMHYPL